MQQHLSDELGIHGDVEMRVLACYGNFMGSLPGCCQSIGTDSCRDFGVGFFVVWVFLLSSFISSQHN